MAYHRRLQTIQRHLTSSSDDGFDVAEVNARYDHERDIRLQKSAGQAQYVKLRELAAQDARFETMLDDPWGTPQKGCCRPAVTDHVEVAVVGAGYGGLTSGARLVLARRAFLLHPLGRLSLGCRWHLEEPGTTSCPSWWSLRSSWSKCSVGWWMSKTPMSWPRPWCAYLSLRATPCLSSRAPSRER